MTSSIFIQILKALSVKYTKHFAVKYYEQHPNKDNLYGLSEMLNFYNIENVAVEFKKDLTALQEMETPFVAFFDHEFVLVSATENGSTDFIWHEKKISLPYEKFLDKWSGVALLLEASESSIEPNYAVNRKSFWLNSISITLLVCLGVFLLLGGLLFNQELKWNTYLLLFIKLFGVGISGLLVAREVSKSNKYTNKLCSLFLKSGDCNHILDSSASKFLGISWSTFGFGFFLTNILLLIFLPNSLLYIEYSILLALPYTIWSIWYQGIKANQWCTLCLLIQCSIWISFIVSTFYIGYDYVRFDMLQAIYVSGFYGFSILVSHFIIRLYTSYLDLRNINYRLNGIKLKDTVFSSLLQEQARYTINPGIGLLLGNKSSNRWITIVSNPHCDPCARLHTQVDTLLGQFHDKFCVQLILTSFNEGLEASAMLLISMYQRNEESSFLRFLSNWYAKGRYCKESYYETYQLDFDDSEIQYSLQQQKEWVRENKISSTPTILVNGYLLPDDYELKDLSNLMN